MIGTIKQFKDILEEMRSTYPFDDSKTKFSTPQTNIAQYDVLELVTVDEKTGVTVHLIKKIEE